MPSLIFFLIISFLGLIVSIFTDNFSIFLFNIAFLSFGHIIIFLMKRQIRIKAHLLFSVFYILSFSYAAITDILYVTNPYVDTFVTPDSTRFFKWADRASNQESISHVFVGSIDQFESAGGYIGFTGVFFYIAKMLDGTHSIILKLFSVFSGGMIAVFLFFILLKLVDERKSFRASLAFVLCSPVFFQSSLILRDIHIMLFFTIMFYIVVEHRRKLFATSIIILLIYLTYLFRPEHGLFSLIFLFFNLFFYAKKRSIMIYVYLFLAMIMLVIGVYKFQIIKHLDYTTETYLDLAKSRNIKKSSGDSFGLALYKLPKYLSVPATAVFSQITPFPFWGPILTDRMANPFRFAQSIHGIFWYFIWVIIVFGIIYKKYRSYSGNLLILLVIPLLLILLATSEVNERRIMAGYPILYCFAIHSFYSFEKGERRLAISVGYLLYIVLMVVYLFIKKW